MKLRKQIFLWGWTQSYAIEHRTQKTKGSDFDYVTKVIQIC